MLKKIYPNPTKYTLLIKVTEYGWEVKRTVMSLIITNHIINLKSALLLKFRLLTESTDPPFETLQNQIFQFLHEVFFVV